MIRAVSCNVVQYKYNVPSLQCPSDDSCHNDIAGAGAKDGHR